ncbi:MAG: MAPEG family protein [Pseudomonadales bacterium]
MMPVTLLYAGVLALLAVLLANQVLYVRLRGGREPDWRANATERVQANFVENVPLALVLLYLVEVGGAGATAVHVLGSLLVLCRVLHAWGMSRNAGANYPRLIGAQGTFLLMSVLGVGAIYLFALGA